MSNEVIFWTQVASIISFVAVLFGLYRSLVEQKDAVIALLKEKNTDLKEKLEEARSISPDVLAESLASRVRILEEEIGRLSKEKTQNKTLIEEKEADLKQVKAEAEKLSRSIARANELLGEVTCPHCGAPISVKEYHSELVGYQGREIDVEHEHLEYECGFTVIDGQVKHPCGNKE